MNPKDFGWTEDQQVTVTNPTSVEFSWKVHSKEYKLGAGRTAKMPGYIAWVYVYNQAVKKALADGKFNSWNDEGFRNPYYDQFVVGTDALVQEVQEEEPDPIELVDDEPEEDEPRPVPAPGTGMNYPTKVKRGRATRA